MKTGQIVRLKIGNESAVKADLHGQLAEFQCKRNDWILVRLQDSDYARKLARQNMRQAQLVESLPEFRMMCLGSLNYYAVLEENIELLES